METAMIDAEMIEESLRLMLIGMSIVFVFLMLLVVCLRAMSWFAAKLAPADWHEAASGLAQAGLSGRHEAALVADNELVAVMAAAVARYRTRGCG